MSMNIKKACIYTLGCKVNSFESEGIESILKLNGYEIVNAKSVADLYVINTCSVTNQADVKSRKVIHQCHKLNDKAIIVVMGCYSQAKAEEVANIEGVSIVLGTINKEYILDYIKEYLDTNKQVIKIFNPRNIDFFDKIKVQEFNKHTRASLKIQDGCNNFCSYCIIPYTRGKLRSKKREDVLAEAKELVQNGYNEIVLNGIHTGGYGVDFKDYNFSDLIDELVQIEGLKRLRISSIEMHELTDRILTHAKNKNVIVDHFHIPIQSGSNEILKKMNRKYNLNEFIDKINHIKEFVPNVAITTDVIVGFPGETEELFMETYKTLKTLEFANLHVFPYSARANTPAAKMPMQIPGDVKKKRVEKLINLSKSLFYNYASKFENETLSILFEKYEDGKLYGHTTNFIYGYVEATDDALVNEIKDVKLIKFDYDNSKFELI